LSLNQLLFLDPTGQLIGDAEQVHADLISISLAEELIDTHRDELIALVMPHVTDRDKEEFLKEYDVDEGEFDQMSYIRTALSFYIADRFL